jgi:hypothetical protein
MPAKAEKYAARRRYSGHMKEQNIFCLRTQARFLLRRRDSKHNTVSLVM